MGTKNNVAVVKRLSGKEMVSYSERQVENKELPNQSQQTKPAADFWKYNSSGTNDVIDTYSSTSGLKDLNKYLMD